MLNAFQDDILDIPYLNEPEVLHFLKSRYERGFIFTYSGSVLVVLNPLHQVKPDSGSGKLIQDFTKDIIEECAINYLNIASSASAGNSSTGKLSPPKPPAITKHSVLISGISGSGKSETCKLVVKSLGEHLRDESLHEETRKNHLFLLDKLQLVNSILDSFGNARTLTTSNSSRYGKLIDLHFGNKSNLLICKINTYLLEGSRIFTQQGNERNYNIFYELLAGCSAEDQQLLCLLPINDYHFLNQGGNIGPTELSGFKKAFIALKSHIEQLNFSNLYFFNVLKVLAGILALGQLKFTGSDFVNGVNAATWNTAAQLLGVDKNDLVRVLTVKTIVTPLKETIHLQLTPQFIEIGRDAVVKFVYRMVFDWLVQELNEMLNVPHFLRPVSVAPVEMSSPMPATPASQRNIPVTPTTTPISVSVSGKHTPIRSGSKSLLRTPSSFSALKSPRSSRKIEVMDTSHIVTSVISVVDIFGFDSFLFNSIDQLCINFANEALQQLFINNMFKLEISLYEKENIHFDKLEYVDNKDNLEFISHGIFKVLDDQCKLPNATDKRFMSQIYRDYERHPLFAGNALLQSEGKFSIMHFAGPVEYSVEGFMNKNMDHMPADIFRILSLSSNALLSLIFPASTYNVPLANLDAPLPGRRASLTVPVSDGNARSIKTGASLVTQFKLELTVLLKEVEASTAHYIKCIKPFDEKESSDTAKTNAAKPVVHFNQFKVSDQLRNGGILEAIRIARSGYRTRLSFFDFYNRYRLVADDIEDGFAGPGHILQSVGLAAAKTYCQQLIEVLSINKRKRTSKKFGQMYQRIHSKSIRNLGELENARPKSFALTRSQLGLSFSAVNIQAYSVEDGIVDDQNIQFGKSRIFLKKREYDFLEVFRNKFLHIKVTMIQTTFRKFYWHKEYTTVCMANQYLQRIFRGCLARKKVYMIRAKRRIAITFQRRYRKRQFRRSIVLIQAWMRRSNAVRLLKFLRERRLRILAAYGQFMIGREIRMHRRVRLVTVKNFVFGIGPAPRIKEVELSTSNLISGESQVSNGVLPCDLSLLRLGSRLPTAEYIMNQNICDYMLLVQSVHGIVQSSSSQKSLSREPAASEFEPLLQQYIAVVTALCNSQIFDDSPVSNQEGTDVDEEVVAHVRDQLETTRIVRVVQIHAARLISHLKPADALLKIKSLVQFSTVGRVMGPSVWSSVTSSSGSIPEVRLFAQHALFHKVHKVEERLATLDKIVHTEVPKILTCIQTQRQCQIAKNRHYNAIKHKDDFFDQAHELIKLIAAVQVSIRKLQLYYHRFIHDACNEYGAQSDFYLSHPNEVQYLRALMQVFNARKQSRLRAHRINSANPNPNRSNGAAVSSDLLPPVDRDCYYPLVLDWPEDEKKESHADNRRSNQHSEDEAANNFDRAQDGHLIKKLRIITHSGHSYKYMPHAPAANFIVNSLFKVLLGQFAGPTKLFKIGHNLGGDSLLMDKCAYYEASLGNQSQSLAQVLYSPIFTEQIDPKSYSAAMMVSCLLGLTQLQPHNVLVSFDPPKVSDVVVSTKDDITLSQGLEAHLDRNGSTRDHYDKVVRILGFDCDEKVINAYKEFKYPHRNKIHKDNVNVLFILPQMDEYLHPLLEDYLLSHKFVAEDIIATWLRTIYEQNLRYSHLAKENFTERDFSNLYLPISLSLGYVSEIYKRLLSMLSALRQAHEKKQNKPADSKEVALKRPLSTGVSAFQLKKQASEYASSGSLACAAMHKDFLTMFYGDLASEYDVRRLQSDFTEGLEISGVVSYAFVYHQCLVDCEKMKTLVPIRANSPSKLNGMLRSFSRKTVTEETESKPEEATTVDYFSAKYSTNAEAAPVAMAAQRSIVPLPAKKYAPGGEDTATTPVVSKVKRGQDGFNDSFWKQITVVPSEDNDVDIPNAKVAQPPTRSIANRRVSFGPEIPVLEEKGGDEKSDLVVPVRPNPLAPRRKSSVRMDDGKAETYSTFDEPGFGDTDKRFMQESPMKARQRQAEAKQKAAAMDRRPSLRPEQVNAFESPVRSEGLVKPSSAPVPPVPVPPVPRTLERAPSIYSRKEEFMPTSPLLLRKSSARIKRTNDEPLSLDSQYINSPSAAPRKSVTTPKRVSIAAESASSGPDFMDLDAIYQTEGAAEQGGTNDNLMRRPSMQPPPAHPAEVIDFGNIYDADEQNEDAARNFSPKAPETVAAPPAITKRPSMLTAIASTLSPSKTPDLPQEVEVELVMDSVEREAAQFLRSLDFKVMQSFPSPATGDFLRRLGESLGFVPRIILVGIDKVQLQLYFSYWTRPKVQQRSVPLRLLVKEIMLKYSSNDEMNAVRKSETLFKLRTQHNVRIFFTVSGKGDDRKSARMASFQVFRAPSRVDMSNKEVVSEYTVPPLDEIETEQSDESSSPVAPSSQPSEDNKKLKATLLKTLMSCTNLVSGEDYQSTRTKVNLVKVVIQHICEEKSGLVADPLKQIRVFEEFMHIALDYPGIASIALAVIKKRGYAHDKLIVHRFLSHLFVDRFEEVILALLESHPDILVLADPLTRYLPCDRIKSLSDSVQCKYRLLAGFINFAAQPSQRHFQKMAIKGSLSAHGIISNYSGEEELIVRAAHFGLMATEKELKVKRYSTAKRCSVKNESLLLKLLVAEVKGDEAGRTDAWEVFQLFNQALKARVLSGEMTRKVAQALVWKDVDMTALPLSLRHDYNINANTLAGSRVYQALRTDWNASAF